MKELEIESGNVIRDIEVIASKSLGSTLFFVEDTPVRPFVEDLDWRPINKA